MKYPTKTQIMEKQENYEIEFIKLLRIWKQKEWLPIHSNNKKVEKQMAIVNMIYIVCRYYEKPITIMFKTSNNDYAYNQKQKQIIMGNKPSIISALHECAHHIFGESELKACRWSIQLFKELFPISYKKLNWKGHMLKK